MNASREIFFNVGPASVFALYALMWVPVGFLAYGVARRVGRWRQGRPENRSDRIGRRLFDALRLTVLHGRIVRRRSIGRGLMHAALFGGFMTLFAGTLIVMVEHDIAGPLFGTSFLRGSFYLGFKLAMNAAGFLVIAGVLLALYRRFVLRPASLETAPDDVLILAFLLVLVLQGFALQALRMAHDANAIAAWSFGSYPLALALSGVSRETLTRWHAFTWHAHFVTAFAFLAYAAYSKMMHPFTALANVVFRRLKPRGELDAIENMEQAETLGAAKLEHFNWAQLMSLDACLHCGRCLELCPTFNTGKALRPRDLVLELAGYQADRGGIFSGVMGEGANSARFRWGKGADRELIGGVVSTEEIWDCTTCGACMEQCPVFIEPVPLIVEMRRNLVMERNEFPRELAPVFTSLERMGNPYQFPPVQRADWTRKLEAPVPVMSEVKRAGKQVDYLFFVGCVGSFVSRNQKVTLALTRILQRAGVSFAILGKEESCHGDPARRMGHEFLAGKLAEKTAQKFELYGVKKVITSCAHCFNAIANEFPQLGGRYEVIHHTQLIAELIAQGRITPAEGSAIGTGKVTYHDPCYLGRYNGVTQEPRDALAAVANVTEMPRNRRQSFCCGGGGGRAFMKEQTGSRINVERVREAVATGAQVVATSCPFCMGMLEDGLGASGGDKTMRVLDLAEIVEGALPPVAGTRKEPKDEEV